MEVLSKLATNTELLGKRTESAGQLLAGTNSILDEASKRNYQLAQDIKTLDEGFDNIYQSEAVQNFVGGAIRGAVSFSQWLSGLYNKLLSVKGAASDANKEFESQRDAYVKLSGSMSPLLDRYDELKKKTVLSKEEQAELKKIVKQVADVIPLAINQFDKYGNAIGVSTGKAREFIDIQKAMMRNANQDAIAKSNEQLDVARKRYAALNQEIMSGQKFTDVAGPGGIAVLRKLTNAELQESLNRRKVLGKEIVETKRLLAGLTGDYLTPKTPAGGGNPSPGPTPPPAAPADDTLTKNEQKAADKAKKVRDKAAKEQLKDEANAIEQIAKMKADAVMDQEQREIAQAKAEADQQLKDIADMKLTTATRAEFEENVKALLVSDLKKIDTKYSEHRKELQKKELDSILKQSLDELAIKANQAQQELLIDKASGRIKEEQYEGKSLAIEQQYILAKQAIYEDYYQNVEKLGIASKEKQIQTATQKKDTEAQLEQDLTDNITRQVQNRIELSDKFMAKTLANEKARKDIITGVLNETLSFMQNNWSQTLAGYKEFWQKASGLQKAAFIAQKAWALADASIQYGRVLMHIWAESGSPWAAIGFTGLATATYANAVAKIASQQYSAPQFGDGGSTALAESMKPEGWVKRPTLFNLGKRSWIGGEAGEEYVISYPMLKDPAVANLVPALEAIRTGRTFASGGSTRMDSASGLPLTSSSMVGITPEMFMMLIRETQATRQALNSYAAKPVDFNVLAHERKMDEIARIRQTTGI